MIFGLINRIILIGMLVGLKAMPKPPIHGEIDKIIVDKSDRVMELWQDGVIVRRYRIGLGSSPEGAKERQGDGKTPEGTFHIDRRNEDSAFHLSLGIDYPQQADIARAAAAGYDPGGDIMFHGQPNQLADNLMIPGDWTLGCIALTNSQIEELWRVTPIGTVVQIRA